MLSQAQVFDCVHDLPHPIIHRRHHFGIRVVSIFARSVRYRVLQIVGHIMTEGHGIVGEKRSTAIAPHEIGQKRDVDVRPILVRYILAELAVLVDHRLPVARAFMPSENTIFIESHAVRLLEIVFEKGKLPFSGYRASITGAIQ